MALTIPDLWRMTPWQLGVMLEAHHEVDHEAHQSQLWHGWHVAMFQRAKKMPKLKDIMKPQKEPSKRIDERDILRRMRIFNAVREEQK